MANITFQTSTTVTNYTCRVGQGKNLNSLLGHIIQDGVILNVGFYAVITYLVGGYRARLVFWLLQEQIQ